MTTNHERFKATFKTSGEELTTKQIRDRLRNKYPEMAEGSMLPNDHAKGNESPCKCAKNKRNEPIFDQIKEGLYRVR